jgi:hypothetical protein
MADVFYFTAFSGISSFIGKPYNNYFGAIDQADRADEKLFGVLILDPAGFNHDADFGVVTHVPGAPLLNGTYAFSNHVECLLEVKAITPDPVTKHDISEHRMPLLIDSAGYSWFFV